MTTFLPSDAALVLAALTVIVSVYLIRGLYAALAHARYGLEKARQAAFEAERLKDEFLCSMSHEIRTPLNAIIGMVDLLSATPLNSSQRDYVDSIQRGGDDLLRLVKDIFHSAQSKMAAVSSVSRMDEAPPVETCNVLVAEDNPMSQKVILQQLKTLGCCGKVVTNGQDAVDEAKAHAYDLILMDCKMPGMDGYRAASEIRRYEKKELHTPIVAVTACALDEDREKCLAAGMDDYVSKPLRTADLNAVVSRWIKGPAPFDLTVLHEAADGNWKDIRHLADVYLENTRGVLEKLSRAVEQKDVPAIERHAHGGAGSSVSFGAKNLSAKFRELEHIASTLRMAEIVPAFERCCEEFNRLEAYVEPLLSRPAAA